MAVGAEQPASATCSQAHGRASAKGTAETSQITVPTQEHTYLSGNAAHNLHADNTHINCRLRATAIPPTPERPMVCDIGEVPETLRDVCNVMRKTCCVMRAEELGSMEYLLHNTLNGCNRFRYVENRRSLVEVMKCCVIHDACYVNDSSAQVMRSMNLPRVCVCAILWPVHRRRRCAEWSLRRDSGQSVAAQWAGHSDQNHTVHSTHRCRPD